MGISDDLLRLTRRLHLEPHERTGRLWQPPADIYRTPDGWVLKFELAGISPRDIEIKVHGRLFSIRGHRADLEVREGRQCYSLEIAYNAFQRTIELPRPVDAARIETEYRSGMLFVHLVTEDSRHE